MKWKMPKWMGKYAKHINNTGGNKIEDLVNGKADINCNAILALMQMSVQGQVQLLELLHKEDLLK